MLAFPLLARDAGAVQRRLHDEYRVEVQIKRNGRHFVRVSIQGYNTAEDVETLLEALVRLLPQVSTSPAGEE